VIAALARGHDDLFSSKEDAVASATTKHGKDSKPRPQGSLKRTESRARPTWLIAAVATAILVALVSGVVALATRSEDGGASAGGLPNTPDYHSLLVGPKRADALLLGTHEGLFRSADGGSTWTKAELDGRDAMNLARPAERTVWAAGHGVLAKSTDGGVSWEDVEPAGLPGLDVHGFAADPQDPNRLYAAIAGEGLYRSTDGGRSFSLVSKVVGPGVMALAVLDDGTVLAGDVQRQALAASADGGTTWKGVIEAGVHGLAVNPTRPELVLAAGPGVLRSTDGGSTWEQPLALDEGAGPIAWAPSDPRVAYVVGFDRSLWRSDDFGATWTSVTAEER
jgi:photosystem II stability/assembly factor-like uncharacterized protein